MGKFTFFLQKYIEFDQSDKGIIKKAIVTVSTTFTIISIAVNFENYRKCTNWVLEQRVEDIYPLRTEILSEFAKRLTPFVVPPTENRMDFANHSTIIDSILL